MILSLQELKLVLDPVARFRHGEFKARLTRLVGRLKDSRHIDQTQLHPARTKFVFPQTLSEARARSATCREPWGRLGGFRATSFLQGRLGDGGRCF